MIDSFLLYALLAGCGVALAAGPLGCFVVWQRMAYFSDSLAHSALLGIALALVAGVSVHLGIFITGIVFAAALIALRAYKNLPFDTLLGLLAHSALAVGMVALALTDTIIDWHQILFGDLLTLTRADVVLIFVSHAFVLVMLAWFWQKLILVTISEELAQAEGFHPLAAQVVLVLSLALLVMSSFGTVGVLLITSLLIIPPAVAHFYTRSPLAMAAAAAGVGIVSVIAGVAASLWVDVPAGPAIISVAAAMFFFTLFVRAAVGVLGKTRDEK